MRDKTTGSVKRLQFDTDGQLVGTLISTAFGELVFLLEPNFLLVQDQVTRQLGLWNCDKRRVVKFAPNTVEVEINGEPDSE